jgi:hypothetical protein
MVKNTKEIEDMIVRTYRAGKCDHNGVTYPRERWGNAGKGCHFIGSALINNDSWPTKIVKLWPRDENGNLIED